jgi:hypothetical protein
MIKAVLTVLISISFLVNVQGQERKDLAVSVSAGLLNSPFYKDAVGRGFFKIDFDYHLTSRHIIAANYLAGQHYYYDDILSNDPISIGYPNGTNSIAEYRTTSVMYKYKIIDNSRFGIVPGTGAGVLTHTRVYPYKEERKSYNRISSWSDLVFPVSLDINYKISSRLQFGLKGGFLFHPDYPILALHAGPKLLFVLP